MATGTNIKTYFNGTWHSGDIPVMNAADHGSWLGSTVFDGARHIDGLAPDLMAHCERVNRSAEALMITPNHTAQEIFDIAWAGLKLFEEGTPVYIRPMYWAIHGGHMGILPQAGSTGFCISLEEIPMAQPDQAATLTTTQFRRPVLADNVVNAKAGCLYPNNARMLAEAGAKGYSNALVCDAAGNVAETATANVFMAKDGVVFTPIPNGTFLSGITRARHIKNLRENGVEVVETVMSYDHFRQADEVFLSGNLNKVTPVSEFDGTHYQLGPITRLVREMYWDWAKTDAA
ncbi:branched-chain amino acid aminotransferase [Rhodophyticola sp. SM2404]